MEESCGACRKWKRVGQVTGTGWDRLQDSVHRSAGMSMLRKCITAVLHPPEGLREEDDGAEH